MYHYSYTDYVGRKIEEYCSKKLSLMPYAKAGVNIYVYGANARYLLVSYSTPICEVFYIDGIGKFFVAGPVNISRTTIRHTIAFLKEYAPEVTYFQSKEMFKEISAQYGMNVETGELIEYNELLKLYKTH